MATSGLGEQTRANERDKIRVVLVDDHHLFREGLCHLLESTGEVTVVGEAANGEEAIARVRELQPRVVLMDINMPAIDGIHATEAVSRCCPDTNIIVLTMAWDDDYAIKAIRAGAKGYLLKSSRSEDVLRAVRLAASGGSAIDPSLAPLLMREYHRMMSRDVAPRAEAVGLTRRELDLLRLLANGFSNRQIANKLDLAESTVKNNLSALFQKIGVRDRTQAVLYAFNEGLVRKPTKESDMG